MSEKRAPGRLDDLLGGLLGGQGGSGGGGLGDLLGGLTGGGGSTSAGGGLMAALLPMLGKLSRTVA